MRNYVAILLVAFVMGGCANYPGSGPFVGGVVGGATGAGVGAALCGYNPACMVIGSVVGAMAGGAVGQSVEQTRIQQSQPYYGAPQPQVTYVPGADPGADAAYQAGRRQYLAQQERQRQAAAFAAGVRGY